MARKNEKSLRTLGDKELGSVAGGFSMQDVLASPVSISLSLPQTNVSNTTQVVAGNIGGGPVSVGSQTFQGNVANINL